MPERTVRELAEGWIAAFNARDLDAMLEMAADDIQFETLHRGTLGRDDLPAFLERQSYGVGLYIVTEDSQEREGYLVQTARTEWRDVETGEVKGSQRSAAAFRARAGKLSWMKIYPSVEAALASAPWASAPRSST